MHVIRLQPPQICGRTVRFSWTVEPETALYRQSEFTLEFPSTVDLTAVPSGLWWRIALTCLHPHWVLLRPCRVVLPVRLAPGEREFWLRLCDAAVWSLEARVDGRDTVRTVDLVETGEALAPLAPVADSGVTAACFSGGRDSLTQLALLQELGQRPLLVTTTSPREGSVEHETARRRHVMDEVVRRREVELVEVRSDLRAGCDNDFAGPRYGVAVCELGDCHLYFAAALAVAAARGARRIVLASEAEVQQSQRRDGMIVQHHHFMYSAVTQRALQALLEPTGIRYGGLTSAVRQFQVQRLLTARYADLRDLQYSCWDLSADEQACSACGECAGIAFNLMADGVSPTVAGIDVATLVGAIEVWRPDRESRQPPGPSRQSGQDHRSQLLRRIQALPAERLAQFGVDDPLLAGYATERAAMLASTEPLAPEPGYPAAYLDLVDEPLRSGLATIIGEHFAPAQDGFDAAGLQRTLTLSDWIAAPLHDPGLDRRRARRAPAPLRSTRPGPTDPEPLTGARARPDPAQHPRTGARARGRARRAGAASRRHLVGRQRAPVPRRVPGHQLRILGRRLRRSLRTRFRRGDRLRACRRLLQRHRRPPAGVRCGRDRSRRRDRHAHLHDDRDRERGQPPRGHAGLRRQRSGDLEPRRRSRRRGDRSPDPRDRGRAHLRPAGRPRSTARPGAAQRSRADRGRGAGARRYGPR